MDCPVGHVVERHADAGADPDQLVQQAGGPDVLGHRAAEDRVGRRREDPAEVAAGGQVDVEVAGTVGLGQVAGAVGREGADLDARRQRDGDRGVRHPAVLDDAVDEAELGPGEVERAADQRVRHDRHGRRRRRRRIEVEDGRVDDVAARRSLEPVVLAVVEGGIEGREEDRVAGRVLDCDCRAGNRAAGVIGENAGDRSVGRVGEGHRDGLPGQQ